MSDLSRLKHLSFEAGPNCNLASQHLFCPILQMKRRGTRRITPADVARVTNEALALGFRGYVGFHYFNEPLLYPEFIRESARLSDYPRRVLWTNGMLLNPEPQDNDILALFEWVHISDYDGSRGGPWLSAHSACYPQVNIQVRQITPDDRLRNLVESSSEVSSDVACLRQRLEVPIDCHGEVHLCCQDWSGSFVMGNILDESLSEILLRNEPMLANLEGGHGPVPAVCGVCHNRVHQGDW